MLPYSPVVGRKPQHIISKSAILHLCQMVPSSSRLGSLSIVSSRRFSFVGLLVGDTHRPSVISYPADVPCSRPLLTCSITSVIFVFSLTQMFVFLPRYMMFNKRLSIVVCPAASLLFTRVVSGSWKYT